MRTLPLALIGIAAVALMQSSCSTLNLSARNPVAQKALSWEGRYYKRGARKQCANFVATCLESTGVKPPRGRAVAQSYTKVGRKVSVPQSGDIVLLHGTYNGPNYVTHVGIMVDSKTFVHRPTFRGPVQRATLASYQGHIAGFRRVSVPGTPVVPHMLNPWAPSTIPPGSRIGTHSKIRNTA